MDKNGAPDSSKKRLVILLSGLLLLLVAGTVLAVMGRDTSPDFEQVKQMRKDLFDKMRNDKDLTPDQRKDMWREYSKIVKSLPFDKRKQLYQDKQQKSLKRLEEYYALSEEERKAYLDKQIQDGDQRRKDRDAKRQANGDNPRPGRNQPNDPNANPGAEGDATNGTNGRPQRDGALADQQHRDNLQMSTPEQRAAQADYRYQIKQEAQALGLPVPRGGGGPGGGGGRGPRGGGGGPPGGGGGAPPPPVGP
jgi:hypothetical protein